MTYRIVIADDQSVTRTILTEVVRRASERTEVLAFGDGASALTEMAKGTVDLLLTDFKMPGLNGLELIETVRRTNKDNSCERSEPRVVLVVGRARSHAEGGLG